MKRLYRFMYAGFITALCIILLCVTSFAATTISGNESRSGVAYRLNDDNTSYEVVGYSEHQSVITILAEIDGIPVTSIKNDAFHNNEYINTISIPSTVKQIGEAAFRDCKNLTKVTFEGSIESLPKECFYGCKMLYSVNLPNGLLTIGDDCFKNCTMLGSVKIPSTVTEIGHDAFLNCERLLLDVTENEYAAEYAKNENLNTDFKNSTAYFLIIVAASVIVGTIVFIILSKLMNKHIKKHPTHNPSIYIHKFFSYIGKFFALICLGIKNVVKFSISKIIFLFKKAKNKLFGKSHQTELQNDENDRKTD